MSAAPAAGYSNIVEGLCLAALLSDSGAGGGVGIEAGAVNNHQMLPINNGGYHLKPLKGVGKKYVGLVGLAG